MNVRAGVEWVVRLHAARLGGRERRALRRWLASSSEHARDLLRSEAVWRLSGALAGDAEVQAELAAIPRPAGAWSASVWRWPLAAATLVLLAASLTLLWPRDATYETRKGEQRLVTLTDGSTVALNTATRIVIDYAPRERRVLLEAGEALFEVVARDARPFIVVAGSGAVRAVGTRFNVWREERAVTVSVLEGRVEVTQRAASPSSPTQLSAGQSAAWEPGGRLVQVTREQTSRERIVAWREGKLRFDAWPLARALEEHNRYAATPIRLPDHELAAVSVSGVFRIGDTAALLAALEQVLDVQARHRDGEWQLVPASHPSRGAPPAPGGPSAPPPAP